MSHELGGRRCPGSWVLTSASDPRWDCVGLAAHISVLEMPREAQVYLDKKKAELGSEPPEDLVIECVKE